jgi:uncharacterized cupin superfamily protein
MITIQHLSPEEQKQKGIPKWPVWEKEVSRFDWFYDSAEYCQILEGRAEIESETEKVEIRAGDFVTFPRGLKCVWTIKEPIRKHYKFE